MVDGGAAGEDPGVVEIGAVVGSGAGVGSGAAVADSVAARGAGAGRTILLLDDTSVVPDGREPLLDIALGPALLQQVADAGGQELRQVPELLRVYRPRPTLAFSGRDCAGAGIGAAAAVARTAGFSPVRRGPGGRGAGYHRGALCLDHVGAEAFGPQRIRPRFAAFGALIAGALREVGVDAGVGPVPGEYCPGEFSINDGRGHKLVGTAQRLVRGAWLFGTVILVSDAEPIRDVLTGVYTALDLSWDPETVGAVQDSAPGVTVTNVHDALLAAYARLGGLEPGETSQDAIALARSRADRHRLPG